MRTAAFILVTLVIFCGWSLLLAGRGQRPVSEATVYAGLLFASQIVLTEILLGACGVLRLPLLLAANLAVSGAVAGWAWRRRTAPAARAADGVGAQLAPASRDTVAAIRAATGSPANLALLALAAAWLVWMLVAADLLPPRGVDDLAYHLPPLYDYVQTGRITLLPVELRAQFALPLGGEFLFLWPLIFFHGDTWVDFVQVPVALFGVAVLYALARALAVGRRDALFAGLLFLFTPVILGQAGSNYVDLIVVVDHLVLLYAVVRFWQTGAFVHLLLAGLASGFGLGVKYNLLVPIVAVQPLILLRLWQDATLRAAALAYVGYVAAALPLAGYWLIRNALVTGFPLFPYRLTWTGLAYMGGATEALVATAGQLAPGGSAGAAAAAVPAPLSAAAAFLEAPGRFLLYLFQDPGLGSLNGGFGPVFWALGLPALAWCGWRAIRVAALGAALPAPGPAITGAGVTGPGVTGPGVTGPGMGSRDFFPLLFWGQVVPVVLVFVLQIDVYRLPFNMRLIVVVVAMASLALAILVGRLRAELPAAAMLLRAFGVGAAALAVVQLATYTLLPYQIGPAALDRAHGVETTPWRYYRQAIDGLPGLGPAWDTLDYLTGPGPGWAVYLAADWRAFEAAPVYGSLMQNRVWNFTRDPAANATAAEPDAFLFYPSGPDAALFYVGPRITPSQVAADGRYELVSVDGDGLLWVRRDVLAPADMRARLLAYYRRRYGGDIEALRAIVPQLPKDGVVVTASALGHGLRYLAMTGELALPVTLAAQNDEARVARQLGAGTVISVPAPLRGFAARPAATLATAAGSVVFYVNDSRGAGPAAVDAALPAPAATDDSR